jgi:hypothetical protein
MLVNHVLAYLMRAPNTLFRRTQAKAGGILQCRPLS